MRFINGVLWFVAFTASTTSLLMVAELIQFVSSVTVNDEAYGFARRKVFRLWLWMLLAWSSWCWLYTH